MLGEALDSFECAVGLERGCVKVEMVEGCDFAGEGGRPCGQVDSSSIVLTFSSPCVFVLASASFTERENLRDVAVCPLSKSCNLSVAHSLCVLDRA